MQGLCDGDREHVGHGAGARAGPQPGRVATADRWVRVRVRVMEPVHVLGHSQVG